MIPKIIHYCWFGNKELPDKVKSCISTWEKILPEYEIICWNETNFDVDICDFTREAYEVGKYAFVSDYVRFYALDKLGGIYLDTDMEILKPIDELLKNNYFFGFENETGRVASCMIGSKKNHLFNKEMLNYYNERSFILDNKKFDMRPNTLIIEDVLNEKYGYRLNGKEIILDDIHIYPNDYLHPLNIITNELNITNNTYAIHWHTGLWVGWRTKLVKFIRLNIFIPLFGENGYRFIENFRKR